MKSIDFPEANVSIAKDQPEYATLYACLLNNKAKEMICEFELTYEEVAEIVKNKRLFYSQFTFGQLFQPMRIMTSSPFLNPIIAENPPMDENRTPAEEWDKTHYIAEPEQHGPCLNCGKGVNQHFYSTHQCKL